MAKITLAALSAQFVAEQSLVAAAAKEVASRIDAQQRQLRAAFARIEALEKAAADSRPRQQSGWRPSYIAAVEAAGRKYPGKTLKVVAGAVYAQIDGDWRAV